VASLHWNDIQLHISTPTNGEHSSDDNDICYVVVQFTEASGSLNLLKNQQQDTYNNRKPYPKPYPNISPKLKQLLFKFETVSKTRATL
jgi:hypothetical protein